MMHLPLEVFQIRQLLSSDADASCNPSGLKATALTGPLWPDSLVWKSPVDDHIRMKLSDEAVATFVLSEENATALTAPAVCRSPHTNVPVSLLHNLAVLSCDADAISVP